MAGERPERRPDLEQVVGEAAVVLVLRGLPCGVVDECVEFGLDWLDLAFEPGAVVVFAEAVPGVEEQACESEAVLAEGFLGRESFGVVAEVSLEV